MPVNQSVVLIIKLLLSHRHVLFGQNAVVALMKSGCERNCYL